MTKPRLYIGIDAGTNTGIAEWSTTSKKFLVIGTVKIHVAMKAVEVVHGLIGSDMMVIIEDARLRKWIPRQPNMKHELGKAAGAGSVKRDCSIWEDFLTDHKIPFLMVKPKAGSTKWSAEKFKAYTKWEGRTSNHSRDAAVLVFGK